MEQLELFEESNLKTFAVIFCSCIMEDQPACRFTSRRDGIGRPVCRPGRFGVVWERQEIIKTDLSKDAADKLAKV